MVTIQVMPRKPKLQNVAPSTLFKRQDGRQVRRMTIYLPEDLRKKLLHFCVEDDREISSVIEEAVERLLEKPQKRTS